jgi:hypothetical protein
MKSLTIRKPTTASIKNYKTQNKKHALEIFLSTKKSFTIQKKTKQTLNLHQLSLKKSKYSQIGIEI